MKTREQIISALRRLEADWPDDLWLFAADGTLCLMEKGEDGKRQLVANADCLNPDAIIASFPGIECDGGDW